jgi:hypothetical protein
MRTVIVVYVSSGVRINTFETNLRLEKMRVTAPAEAPVGPESTPLVRRTPMHLVPGVYRVESKRPLSLSCDVEGSVIFAGYRDAKSVTPNADTSGVVIVSSDPEVPNDRDIVPDPPTRMPMECDPATFPADFRTFFWDGNKPDNVVVDAQGPQVASAR